MLFDRRHDERLSKVLGGVWTSDIYSCEGIITVIWYPGVDGEDVPKMFLKVGYAKFSYPWYVYGNAISPEFYHHNIGEAYEASYDAHIQERADFHGGFRCMAFVHSSRLTNLLPNITRPITAVTNWKEPFKKDDEIVVDTQGDMYYQRKKYQKNEKYQIPLYIGSAGVCEVALRCCILGALISGVQPQNGVPQMVSAPCTVNAIKYASDKKLPNLKGVFTGVWPSPGGGTGEMFAIDLAETTEAAVENAIKAGIQAFLNISTPCRRLSVSMAMQSYHTFQWLNAAIVSTYMSQDAVTKCTTAAGKC